MTDASCRLFFGASARRSMRAMMTSWIVSGWTISSRRCSGRNDPAPRRIHPAPAATGRPPRRTTDFLRPFTRSGLADHPREVVIGPARPFAISTLSFARRHRAGARLIAVLVEWVACSRGGTSGSGGSGRWDAVGVNSRLSSLAFSIPCTSSCTITCGRTSRRAAAGADAARRRSRRDAAQDPSSRPRHLRDRATRRVIKVEQDRAEILTEQRNVAGSSFRAIGPFRIAFFDAEVTVSACS